MDVEQKYRWIQKVDDAKTLTYKTLRPNSCFTAEMLSDFQKNLQENRVDRFRILLHPNQDDKLHDMIIAMQKNTHVKPHKHKNSESYHILSGSMLLIYFDDDGNAIDAISMGLKDNLIVRVDASSYHAAVALEDTVYHESRIGPFIADTDSDFATWEVDFQHYMEMLS